MVMGLEGARVVSAQIAGGQQLLAGAVEAFLHAIALKGVMFVRGRAKKLVFLGGVLFPADTADDRILRMVAALHGMPKSPTVGTLLDQGQRLEALRMYGPTKHEEGGLQDMRGGLAILIKEGEGNQPMMGLSRHVSLKPMGVGKECDAGAEHITAQFGPEFIGARKGARLVVHNWDHM
jgi:hypothetical protein